MLIQHDLRISTLSSRWSAQMHNRENSSSHSLLTDSHREFTSFQPGRKISVRVTGTRSDLPGAWDVAMNEDPCCCCTLWLITFPSKWEARSDRGSYPFKGGISPSTASTLKHSNSYLINGCLLCHYGFVHWGLQYHLLLSVQFFKNITIKVRSVPAIKRPDSFSLLKTSATSKVVFSFIQRVKIKKIYDLNYCATYYCLSKL